MPRTKHTAPSSALERAGCGVALSYGMKAHGGILGTRLHDAMGFGADRKSSRDFSSSGRNLAREGWGSKGRERVYFEAAAAKNRGRFSFRRLNGTSEGAEVKNYFQRETER